MSAVPCPDRARQPTRILLATAAGYTNVGDDAIAHAVLARLAAEFRDARIVVIAGRHLPAAALPPASRLDWDNLDRLAEAVAEADAVVLGGGGLLYDSTFRAAAVDLFRRTPHWLVRAAKLAVLARISGRPLMLYSIGVGPLVSPAGRGLARLVAESAQCVTVRDDYSRQALAECGIAEGALRLAADPALELAPTADEPAAALLGRSGLAQLPRPLIGLNLRPWFRFQGVALASRPEMDDLLAAAEDAVERLAQQTGGSVIGMPLQAGRDGDALVLRRVLRRLLRRNRAAMVGPRSPAAALAVASQMDVMIGMRLHAHIFAADCAVPSVALAYDPKVACLMSDLGMEEFMLPAHGVTSESIAGATMRALRLRVELRQRIRSRRAGLRERCDEPVRLLRDLLRAGTPQRAPASASAADDAAGWRAERAALLHYIASLQRAPDSWFMRALEPVRWAAEALRRLAGRG